MYMIQSYHMKMGFIGLGRMGKNIVLNLLEHDIEVVAWNRSPEPREELKKKLKLSNLAQKISQL